MLRVVALRLEVPEIPAAGLVELLGDPHRSVHAYTRLLTLGPAAAEAARHGLSSPDARVREQCCRPRSTCSPATRRRTIVAPRKMRRRRCGRKHCGTPPAALSTGGPSLACDYGGVSSPGTAAAWTEQQVD